LARVVSSAVYGIDPLIMGLAPAWAIPLALQRAGLAPEQVDVWEVHEAFSAQALGVLRELPTSSGFHGPRRQTDAQWGSGRHRTPFGASGTRYVLTLATETARAQCALRSYRLCVAQDRASPCPGKPRCNVVATYHIESSMTLRDNEMQRRRPRRCANSSVFSARAVPVSCARVLLPPRGRGAVQVDGRNADHHLRLQQPSGGSTSATTFMNCSATARSDSAAV